MNSRFALFLVAVFASSASADSKDSTCSYLFNTSILLYYAREYRTMVYRGSPADFSSLDFYNSSYINQMEKEHVWRWFLGYNNEAFRIEYEHPRVVSNTYGAALGIVSSPDYAYLHNIWSFHVAEQYNRWYNPARVELFSALRNNRSIWVMPDHVTFYNNILFYQGKKWFDISNKTFYDLENEVQDEKWRPGAVMDLVDGTYYPQDTKNEFEEKLLAVYDGKKVYRKLCENKKTKFERAKDLGVDDVDTFFCFYVDDCEVGYVLAALASDIFVFPYPKNPIQMKPIPTPGPTSPTTYALSSLLNSSAVAFSVSTNDSSTSADSVVIPETTVHQASTPVDGSSSSTRTANSNKTTPKTNSNSAIKTPTDPSSNSETQKNRTSFYLSIVWLQIVVLVLLLLLLVAQCFIAYKMTRRHSTATAQQVKPTTKATSHIELGECIYFQKEPQVKRRKL
ncbi:hypothetical protein L596_009599 [Steinernema carpocapsae]|uniref:Uncharacterized protein n=1 Tax=Steinernema carpocapsae TaxID=34508 RepID=A0A4U5PFT7_STECR|nr:hypothetical protein L596_009599 [Steinernema carpocapsae]